jgi:hypothetical protein
MVAAAQGEAGCGNLMMATKEPQLQLIPFLFFDINSTAVILLWHEFYFANHRNSSTMAPK